MEVTAGYIFGLIVTAAIGFISWSLKELYGRIKSDREEVKQTISEMEKKFEIIADKTEQKIYRVESKLTDNYVTKDDFFREINKLDMKIDTIQENITEISKNIAALVGRGE